MGNSPISSTTSPSQTEFFAGTITRDSAAVDGSVAETGVGFTPKSIRFEWVDATFTLFGTGWTDSAKNYSFRKNNRNGTIGNHSIGTISCISFTEAGATFDIANATIASFDADGFTLAWVKTGTPIGIMTINYIAQR